jgi:hypothetical protein
MDILIQDRIMGLIEWAEGSGRGGAAKARLSKRRPLDLLYVGDADECDNKHMVPLNRITNRYAARYQQRMHSMSSFATKGVSVSTTRSPTSTDSVSTDNISVTDRHLARLAGGDE